VCDHSSSLPIQLCSEDLLVRIVRLCQPLCLFLADDCCPLPTTRPEQVLSVVDLHLHAPCRPAGALLHHWCPCAECLHVTWSGLSLREFLSFQQLLRSIAFDTELTGADLALLRPHMSALMTVHVADVSSGPADVVSACAVSSNTRPTSRRSVSHTGSPRALIREDWTSCWLSHAISRGCRCLP
jgi:hypothetical protein